MLWDMDVPTRASRGGERKAFSEEEEEAKRGC